MPKVRIKAEGSSIQEFQLRPGPNRLGRADTNDFQIDHASVSANHCELTVGEDNARLRDLGSTNGTFVGGERIFDVMIKRGQSFSLGSLEMVFDPPDSEGRKADQVCPTHPRVQAKVECTKCGTYLCDYCVTTRFASGVLKKLCRRCKSECTWLHPPKPAQSDDRRVAALLMNALRYPLQRHGWVLLLGGTLLLFLIDVTMAGLSNGTPASAAMALVIGVLAGGYLFSFLQRIITTSAMGEMLMPGWPDFTELYQDMIQPFRLLWGLAMACFGPALICAYLAHEGSLVAGKLFWPILAVGFAYLPMATLGVAMSDSLSALNPLFVGAAIKKVPLQYLLACAILGMMIGLKWLMETAMENVIPLFFVRYLISAILLLYFLVIEARILGLVYLWNRRRLAWLNLG